MKMSDIKYGLFKYEVKDYYSVLGVPIDATAKEIRLRYLKIAYLLHPDTCTAETSEEKEKASQILSKLVNPAYENLYQDKLRKECQLIFSEIARRFSSNNYEVTVVSDTAQKLMEQDEKSLDKIYRETVGKFASDLYQDVNKVHQKIGLISELNMVYLMTNTMGASSSSSRMGSTKPIVTQSSASTSNQSPQTEANDSGDLEQSGDSRIDKLISSAQQHLEDRNFEQGILDLREALKEDPNNSTCHALLGSLYLKQGNIPYAKIHINKANQLNYDDPIVQQSRKELKEVDGTSDSSQGKKGKSTKSKGKKVSKSQSASKSKDKDKEGKKEPPKIFGIPLW